MRYSSFGSLFASLLLAACGGGGGGATTPPPAPPPPAPTPVTGVFAGPVVGLHYSTPTREGATNALGQFTYLPGETVTFSIGGVQVGSAPGAPAMSLFHLYGATPPITEAGLRLELSTRNNVTGFDRAANLTLLFASLDVDGNPANGLDLTGWNATLAGKTLNVEWPLFFFKTRAFDRFARVNGIHRNLSPARAVAELYRGMGVAVPVKAVTSQSEDRDDDGTFERGTVFEYDAQGRVVVTHYDGDLDGIDNQVQRDTYGANGQVVTSILDTDTDDDGAANIRQTSTVTYDVAGNRTGDLREVDQGINGSVETREVNTYTYDAAGNRTRRLRELDLDGNGVVNYRQTTDYTFTASGEVLTRDDSQDTNGDGVVNNRSHEINTYDTAGNQLTSTIELDEDANGTPNRWNRWTSTYDAAGNRLTSMYEQDDNIDGTLEFLQTDSVTWNAAGQRVSAHQEVDGSGQHLEYEFSWTYNTNNDLLVVREEADSADYQYRQVTTHTYDAAGNHTAEHTEYDAGSDGILDGIHDWSATYGASHGLISMRSRTEEGTDVEAWRRAYVNDTTLADGVPYLVTLYEQAEDN